MPNWGLSKLLSSQEYTCFLRQPDCVSLSMFLSQESEDLKSAKPKASTAGMLFAWTLLNQIETTLPRFTQCFLLFIYLSCFVFTHIWWIFWFFFTIQFGKLLFCNNIHVSNTLLSFIVIFDLFIAWYISFIEMVFLFIFIPTSDFKVSDVWKWYIDNIIITNLKYSDVSNHQISLNVTVLRWLLSQSKFAGSLAFKERIDGLLYEGNTVKAVYSRHLVIPDTF